MNVLILSYSDLAGGAARAAFRLHQLLLSSKINSRMLVVDKQSDSLEVLGVPSKKAKLVSFWKRFVALKIVSMLKTKNSVLHSPAFLANNGLVNWINSTDADVVNIHWICGEMLSIEDIQKIKKPIVWTLHDMWAFCGAEHYTEDDIRWKDGYYKKNRPSYENGFDLNKWVWCRKFKAWKQPMHVITPSKWLAECVRYSALMQSWPVTVIPNPLDKKIWRPVEKNQARGILQLPSDTALLAFGAIGGGKDPRKGIDLLMSAIIELKKITQRRIELVVFGESEPTHSIDVGFPVHYMGHLHDDLSLRILYSAVNCMIIPSRQENLPNTGLEALACGTPIVGFDIGGLPDLIIHKQNGWLAKAFDVSDLASGINWVLENNESLVGNSIESFEVNLDADLIIRHYISKYNEAIKSNVK